MHDTLIDLRAGSAKPIREWSASRGLVAAQVISFAAALTMVVVAASVRRLLDPILGEDHPFIFFFVPVLVSAWYCGWKAGALALVVGLMTALYLFVTPRGSIFGSSIPDQIGATAFFVVGSISIILVESLNRANLRTEAQAALLQAEIGGHERTQEQLRQANTRLERRVEESAAELNIAADQLHDEGAARRMAEARERRLGAIVASSDDAIIGKDLVGRITDWNAGAERLFGYTAGEAIGRPVSMLVPDDRQEELARVTEQLVRGEEIRPFETMRLRKDGSEVPVSVRISLIRENGKLVGQASINRDLTHARQLEEQLRQAQKMEAVGQLAGGVAHDFNNILTVINGYAEMLLGDMRPHHPDRSMLQQIADAGNRATALTSQLLAFSRKQVLQPQAVDLNETVKKSEKMLRRLIGENVRLTTVQGNGLGHVKVDPGQMEQVIMNLSVNARDAMPGGGRLIIETADVELDEDYARTHAEVWPGRYALLAVSDTGTGMDEETKARIFEPFFTTKEVGKGTGLGLAMVHGIIKSSGGHIAVYSEKGRGTTFEIYLPAVEGLRSAVKSHTGAEAPRGAETILLVEDEEAVRRLTKMALETVGYTVLEAVHGGDAVRLAEAHDGPIHLLVSDVVMPEMGGRVLAERLGASRPGLRVVFVSGYTDNEVVHPGGSEAGIVFLQKPFSPVSLSRKVRQALDSRT